VNDPASTRRIAHAPDAVRAVETIGDVLTDLVDLTEQLPVRLDQAQFAARVLDRLSEELAEAAAMLRTGLPAACKHGRDLARLRLAFPDWHIAWTGGSGGCGFTAARPGRPLISAVTAPVLAARIFDREGDSR